MKEGIKKSLRIAGLFASGAIFYIVLPKIIDLLVPNASTYSYELIWCIYPIMSALMGLIGFYICRNLIIQVIGNFILLLVSIVVATGYPIDDDLYGFIIIYVNISTVFSLLSAGVIWIFATLQKGKVKS